MFVSGIEASIDSDAELTHSFLIINEFMKVIGQLERGETTDPAISSHHLLSSTPITATDDDDACLSKIYMAE